MLTSFIHLDMDHHDIPSLLSIPFPVLVWKTSCWIASSQLLLVPVTGGLVFAVMVNRYTRDIWKWYTTSFTSLYLQSILVAVKGIYVLLVERQQCREGLRCATIRHGGLLVPCITGTSEMPLLCVDICTIHQTVSIIINQSVIYTCSTNDFVLHIQG